jgi:hypothetical protein
VNAIEWILRKVKPLVTRIVASVKRAGTAIVQAGVPKDPNERLKRGMQAALTAVRRIPGSRIGRPALAGVLAAIKLRFGFSFLEPLLRNGRWFIRGQVNPVDEIDTGIESPRENYTIRRLLEHDNQPGALSKEQAKTFRNSLTGLCKLLESPSLVLQKKGVRQTQDIPGSAFVDNPNRRWVSHHGLVCAVYVEEQIAAIEKLREQLTGSEALLALERGGSLLAEQLARGTAVAPTHIPKPEGGDPVKLRASVMVPELISRIRETMKGREKAPVKISVAAAWISGTEAGEIIKAINKLLLSDEFPNLQVHLLAVQQTLGHEHDKKGLVITKEGKVQIARFRIPYIIGEDVTYQSLRDREAKESKQPVIIFRATDEKVVAYEITPKGEGRARDIIIDLATGVLRGMLPGVL